MFLVRGVCSIYIIMYIQIQTGEVELKIGSYNFLILQSLFLSAIQPPPLFILIVYDQVLVRRPGGARDVHAVLGLGAHGPKKVLKKGDVASK